MQNKHLYIQFLLLVYTFIIISCGGNSIDDSKETSSKSPDSRTPSDNDTAKVVQTSLDSEINFLDSQVFTDEEEIDSATYSKWEWIDNPTSEDCGSGCTQLTFQEGVREFEWDVWGNRLVYIGSDLRTYVVDVINKKYLQLPEITIDSSDIYAMSYPTIYDNVIFYSQFIRSQPQRREIVKVDLSNNSQEVIWTKDYPVMEEVNGHYLPDWLDASGKRLVCRSCSGDPAFRTLGFLEQPWSRDGMAIIGDRTYGGYNSLWGDNLVFWEHSSTKDDIGGYNFSTGELFYVAEDDAYQFAPRIHNSRVVYMDLRNGESTLDGTWDRAAIFMKDLSTSEVIQITEGKAIASYPDIYNDIVVWADYRNCDNPNVKNDIKNVEIWGYNLFNNSTFKITNLINVPKSYPRIWDNNVFVHMFKEKFNAIYLFELSEN